MADIHLHRARLFGFEVSETGNVYPWESAEHDLREAERLIKKHGYELRLPELEDAKQALLEPA